MPFTAEISSAIIKKLHGRELKTPHFDYLTKKDNRDHTLQLIFGFTGKDIPRKRKTYY